MSLLKLFMAQRATWLLEGGCGLGRRSSTRVFCGLLQLIQLPQGRNCKWAKIPCSGRQGADTLMSTYVTPSEGVI